MSTTAKSLPTRTVSPFLILAVICTGIFVAALDQTVVVTALPSIMTDLELPVTELDRAAWIITAYLLGYTMVMPLMGRFSDVYGHGRIYILSLLVFMGGSVLVAVASSLSWLVAARVIQAIGGGAVVPVAMAIVSDVFPKNRRSIALGVIGAVAEAGSVLGPLYGGVIVEHLSWRWIFWVNLPVGLAVIMLVSIFLKASPLSRGSIDYLGGLLIAASLALLTLALSQEAASARFFLFLAASVLSFILFITRERRAAEPIVKLSMFRSITFSSANLTNLLVGGALIMAMVNIPLITDTIMGQSALEGGLRLMRLTAMIPIGAIAGGFLCHRFGYRLPTMMGLACNSLGFFMMSGWGLDIADPWMTLHLVVAGLGFGLVIAPIATAVINSVGEGQRGVASALVTAMRMVGMMIGLSALSSWGMGRFQALTAGFSLPEIIDSPDILSGPVLSMFQEFFLIAMALCLIALLPALAMGFRSKRH